MTFVGVLGILLSLLAVRWLAVEPSNRKIGFFALIATFHLATTFVYFQYVQSNDADTKLYYFDPYGFYYNQISLGTMFVVHSVQWMKTVVGGTYLDYFLLFQVFGVWGIVLLVRTLEELTIILDHPWPPLFTILILMPGMYFWTSAIGKDAPLFFACSLAVWSTLSISRRWIWFGLAIAVMLPFRPHMALIGIGSLGLALLAGRGVSLALRVALGGLTLIVGVFLFGTVQSAMQVDISSIGSVASYLEQQSTTAANSTDSNTALAAASYPLKLLSLLYRPFFFDAGGVFGLIASVQNVFMLFATFMLMRNLRVWGAMFRDSLPIRFATIFLGTVILLLSFMYYNVGLGLRQREMFTPALYLIFAALYLVALKRRVGRDHSAIRIMPLPARLDPAK